VSMTTRSPTLEDCRRAADFRFALRQFIADADADVRAEGLTPHRYLLMLAIKAAPRECPATITQIADRLQSAQSSVTELVDRAVAAGLVERGGASDGRVVTVALTEQGDEVFARAFAAVRDDRERLLQHLYAR
jgi:DNA-binding MarR family transcriptional regulator